MGGYAAIWFVYHCICHLPSNSNEVNGQNARFYDKSSIIFFVEVVCVVDQQ